MNGDISLYDMPGIEVHSNSSSVQEDEILDDNFNTDEGTISHDSNGEDVEFDSNTSNSEFIVNSSDNNNNINNGNTEEVHSSSDHSVQKIVMFWFEYLINS